MSYEDDLLNDFASDNDSESGDELAPSAIDLDAQLEEVLQNPISFLDKLDLLDVEKVVDPAKYVKVLRLSEVILKRISQFDEQESDFLLLLADSDHQNPEYQFLMQINELINIIHYELAFLFNFIKFKYKVVFPELESIITNPQHFIRIIELVKQDLVGIRDYEKELSQILSADKILVVIMSGLQNIKKQFILSDDDMSIILNACEQYQKLIDLLGKLSSFIQQKLVKYMPNLTNLLGPQTASQILIHAGSLKQLSIIPSCNLPSLGVKEMSSTAKKMSTSVQMGYLYHNELIKNLPPEIIKLALRILSGKVILASRIDLSKSSPDGELGNRYKQEVSEKINKLLTPPEASGVKPLPKPSEYKSKRRGGRKIRKMKQKFQLSEMGKAQNRVTFGQREDSYIDTFGNEVGLGMAKDPSIKVNTHTKATISKSMKTKLANEPDEKKRHLDSVLDDDFGSIVKKQKPDSNRSKWIGNTMKK